MENLMSAKRIEYMDAAKGLAILCVIAGHLGVNTITRLVYPFHIPIFFLISGYFISLKKECRVFAREKAWRLLIPYLVTCAGVCSLSVPADLVRGMTDRVVPDLIRWGLASLYGAGADYKIPFHISEIGAIWFLPALFWAMIIVRYSLEVRHSAAVIGIAAGISHLTSRYIWLPFSVQAGGVAAIFVYIGYLARKHRLFDSMIDKKIFVLGVILWILEYRNNSVMIVAANDYPAGLFDIAASVFICYSVICAAYIINGRTRILKSFLCFCGRNSLVILCFHLLEISMFPWSYMIELLEAVNTAFPLQMFFLFVGKVMFSMAGVAVTLKIPCLKKIFLQ